MIQTNWYVITGGPASGKTTTINRLAEQGYTTTVENARHYIDTQQQTGKTIAELRANQENFQLMVMQLQLQQESKLNPQDLVFLDRALPDALAYYKFLHLPVNQQVLDAINTFRYKKIFMLDLLPMISDYARQENEASQIVIHQLLIEVYTNLH